jgi:hypothetical protein
MSFGGPSRYLLTVCMAVLIGTASAQCTTYTITVGGGTFDYEIDWELVNDLGVTVASGIAPQSVAVCLPNGCYTMYMYDLFGDGWNGASFVIRVQPANTIVSSGTMVNNNFGTAQVNLGGGCGGANCSNYTLAVTAGSFPEEVSWNLISGVLIVGTGFAPTTMTLCLDTGCFVMQLFDQFGDGWNGATWTLTNGSNVVVGSGTLATGTIGQAMIDLSPTTSCASSSPVVASDCPQAVNICTNYNWSVDPNGSGALNEIPPLGSLGNPDYLQGDLINSTWGSDNWGCLRSNELNSTWMIVNISGSGSLEFTFGGLGSQAGFYDWIMYPYNASTCAQVMANQVPPVRCNWNGVSYGGTGLAATTPPGGDPTNYEPPLNVLAGQQYLICFSNWSSVTTSVPLEFGGTATVSCTPIVLPLELVAFTAEQEMESVRLRWTTATEQHTERFIVERMRGAEEWIPIGQLSAAGESQQETRYDFSDGTVPSGHNYYRLRMIDTDGGYTWSPTAHALFRPLGPLVYPNPATSSFWVRSGGEGVMVLDAMGRTVQHDLARIRDDATEITLPHGSSGVFTVLVGDGHCQRAERVVLR